MLISTDAASSFTRWCELFVVRHRGNLFVLVQIDAWSLAPLAESLPGRMVEA